MPYKPKNPCRFPCCIRMAVKAGYCEAHQPSRTPDTRPSGAMRGYNKQWRVIREQVLTAHDIPKEQWHLYDVHHVPEYNPAVEPDHHKYTLLPLPHGQHSRETGRSKGGHNLCGKKC